MGIPEIISTSKQGKNNVTLIRAIDAQLVFQNESCQQKNKLRSHRNRHLDKKEYRHFSGKKEKKKTENSVQILSLLIEMSIVEKLIIGAGHLEFRKTS
jgi:hypothetical protein